MNIQGIIPALLTAFSEDGAIDEPNLRRLARYQLDAGAAGFFVCGSAGEGLYMTPAERKRVIEIAVSEAANKAVIIAQVSAMSTDEAVYLARDAQNAGAAAVATLPPLVFRLPWEAVIEHVRAVAEAVDIPTFFYHIPVITNVEATADQIAEMAERVPGLAGLKLTSPDLFLLWGCFERPRRKLEVLYGWDQQLYHGLLTGACGGIGSTYNYQIEYVMDIYRAVRRGDHAAALEAQGKVNKVIEVVFKYGGNRATEKAMTTLRGYDVGPPRRPNLPFPKDRLEDLRRDMELVGLL
ncbi:MAG: dihydrodipicolinate synthase family protein [Candidatus Hydrogenedentes bacterium]|nr:dihydrodipicolinate synthase family protein [Candidatus Hydrogenedentota bacterium]